MVDDLVVNILAGVLLLGLGELSRRLILRVRTRSTRRLWRSATGADLVIALTTRVGDGPHSGNRTTFREVHALTEMIPTLHAIGVRYSVSESLVTTLVPIGSSNVVSIGGPSSNDLSRRLLGEFDSVVDVELRERSFSVFGRTYESRYSPDGSVEEDFGVVIRLPHPFSEDPGLTATVVAGIRFLGTGGAARLLSNEHLIRRLAGQVDLGRFAAVVRTRAVGNDYSSTLETAHRL